MIKAKKINPMPLNNKIFPFYKNISPVERIALSAYFMLTMMGVAVAAFGLVAGMLGDGWQITVPFFVVAEIALIINFPTQKRWQQLLAKISNRPTHNSEKGLIINGARLEGKFMHGNSQFKKQQRKS